MIDDEIKFIGVRDFYIRCDRIRRHYLLLNRQEKELYKYYVYAKRHIREYSCDIIWEFLNEEEGSDFAKSKEKTNLIQLYSFITNY